MKTLIVVVTLLLTSLLFSIHASDDSSEFQLVERYRLEGEISWTKVKYSPQGTYLAGLEQPRIHLFDTVTYEILDKIELAWVFDFTWSPEEDDIAGVPYSDVSSFKLHNWSIEDVQVNQPTIGPEIGWIGSLAWSPTGQMIAFAGETHSILNLNSGEELNLDSYYEAGGYLSWNPTGKLLATAGINDWEDKSKLTYPLRIWNVEDNTMIQIGSGTQALEWSPDGNYLATVSGDYVIIWDTNLWRIVSAFPIVENGWWVYDLAWHRNSSILTVSTNQSNVVSWDVTTNRIVNETHINKEAYTISWSPTEDHLAVGSIDHSIYIFEMLDR